MRWTRSRVVLATAAVAALTVPSMLRNDAAGAARAPAGPSCGVHCRAAYQAIARALPDDSSNTLVRAIVRTPGFGYPELSRALGVPTAGEILAEWRAASRHP
ncbi:MAG TPA: hypothetical protein VF094_04065 [Gaiellaceae bacterium]